MGNRLILWTVVVFFLLTTVGFSSDKNISLVKNSVLTFDKSLTIGEAFESYSFFKSVKWEAFKTDRNRQIVKFIGTFDNGRELLLEGVSYCEENPPKTDMKDKLISAHKKWYDTVNKVSSFSDSDRKEAKKKLLEAEEDKQKIIEKYFSSLQVVKDLADSLDEINMVIQFIINRDNSLEFYHIGYEVLSKHQNLLLNKCAINCDLEIKKIYANKKLFYGEIISSIVEQIK